MTRQLNIAVASTGLGHVTRGIEAWAADLAAALDARGERVTLYKGGGVATESYERVLSCWQRTDKRAERAVRWLRRTCWRLGIGTEYGVEQVTFAAALLGQLRRARTDVLHVQDPQLGLIVQRATRLGITRAAVVLGHGTNESADFLKKIRFLQHLSPWQLDEWRQAGVYRPTWRAIPNFIDVEQYKPGRSPGMREELGIPADALVVLAAAAIKRSHKRIDYLLTEFARFRAASADTPAYLVVAGGREADTDELVRVGHQLLGNRVRFLIQYPRHRMPDLYRAADLFALCSLREMMPIALIEAAASGLPCLVHDHPVLRWIAGGDSIDMTAPGQLAAALSDLAASPSRRECLGGDNRARAVALFSREQVVDQLIDYYRFCFSDRRRPTPAASVV